MSKATANTRSTRKSTKSQPTTTNTTSATSNTTKRKAPAQKTKPAPKKARRSKAATPAPSSEDENEPSAEEDGSDDGDESEYAGSDKSDEKEEQVEEEEEEEMDSDALDESEDEGKKKKKAKGKGRKGKTSPASKGSGVTKTKVIKGPGKDEMVEPGLVAPFTMKFLQDLAKPANNDRDWLALNDPIYRAALVNWNDFITVLVPKLVEADWSLPVLPSKDLVHRIYRDVRFSNDKTPYKTNLSAGFSRSGRKGPWAGYYLHIQPGGKSILAGGKWAPEKNELAAIRQAILRNPKPLRKIIGSKDFIAMFGKPEESSNSKKRRQNVFGHEDTLKNCPKMEGVTKDHKDIDLLKLRTIAAFKHFTDDEVNSEGLIDQVAQTAKVLAPLVQCLNDMISPSSDDEEEEEEAGDEDEDEEEE